MHLEKHAKALIDYPQSSDDEDYPNYKMKALKYRKDYQEAEDIVVKLKYQNTDNKETISQLLADLEVHTKRVMLLEQDLVNQYRQTQDAVEKLKKARQQRQEDRLILEQKKLQEKLTLQSNEAFDKLRQHFDQTMSLLTPKTKR